MADDGQRIADLERRLRAVEERLRRTEAGLARAPAAPAPGAQSPMAWEPVADSPRSAATPALQVERRPVRTPRTLDSLLGANWLARAGMLLLALGVVFFLRLAYDRGWVPIEGRYAIGLAGGLGLWLAGDLLRGRRIDPAFTQVLSGGGAVIAYVTLYVGYAVPDYREALGMTLPIVLPLLAVASVLLAAYAVWRDLPVLAGLAGGLATVLLAPAGDFSTAGVLYATFLDTAILLAAAWRRWDAVALTVLVAANVPILAGFVEGFAWQLLLGCAVVANGAGLAASAAMRSGPRAIACVEGGMAVALLGLAAALALGEAGIRDAAGWALLGVGAMALPLAIALHRPGPGIGGAAVALLILWPLFHFTGDLGAPLALGLLAGAATATGALVPRIRLGADLAALAAAAIGLLAYWGGVEGASMDGQRLRAGAAGLALVAACAAQWAAARGRQREFGWIALGTGLLALLLTLATLLSSWAVTVSWAVVAVAAVAIGLAGKVDELRLAAFGLFALVLLRIFAIDLAGLGVVARVVAFMLTGTLLLVAAFLYARARRTAVP